MGLPTERQKGWPALFGLNSEWLLKSACIILKKLLKAKTFPFDSPVWLCVSPCCTVYWCQYWFVSLLPPSCFSLPEAWPQGSPRVEVIINNKCHLLSWPTASLDAHANTTQTNECTLHCIHKAKCLQRERERKNHVYHTACMESMKQTSYPPG